MTTFNQKKTLLAGLGLCWLGTTPPAAAQCHGGGHSRAGGSGHTQAGWAKRTEANSRGGLQLGWLLALDKRNVLFNGPAVETNYFIGTHLQLGGQLAFTGDAATPTNFGYEATGPVVNFITFGPTLRYMLGNNQRWRLDALSGLSLNVYGLADQDRPVTNPCGCTSAAPVASSRRPSFDAGLGLTYKLRRELWLTSNFRYAQLLGSAPFKAAELQSRWQFSLALALPSGFVRKKASREPAIGLPSVSRDN